MSQPLLGSAGGIIVPLPLLDVSGVITFSCRPSVHVSAQHVVSVISMVCLMDFHRIFVSSASWVDDELIRRWCQKVKSQGHGMTKCPAGGSIQKSLSGYF